MGKMIVHKEIEQMLKRFEKGKVFDYGFFLMDGASSEAIAQTLSRLSRAGKIGKLSRGVYYKLNPSEFGEIGPSESQLLSFLLRDGDRYLTGLRIYNAMGLTTQIPNVITIATNFRKHDQVFGNIRIRYVMTQNRIQAHDVPLLQLLDAIKDMKQIPDASIKFLVPALLNKIKRLNRNDLLRFFRLAMSYRPAIRAFVGAIAELLGYPKAVNQLKKTINQISKFKLGIPEEVLPTKHNWNLS